LCSRGLRRWWCFLVDGDALGLAEVLKLDVLELDAEVFGDSLAAGEMAMSPSMACGDAEARRLDGGDVQRATELVDDEGARASPSTSSATMTSGLRCGNLLGRGRRSSWS